MSTIADALRAKGGAYYTFRNRKGQLIVQLKNAK